MLHEEQRILERLCAETATPLAIKATQLLAAGDWVGLASLSCDPNNYSSAADYLVDCQVVALLKKSEALPTADEAANRAEADFFKAEAMCYKTNERLSPLISNLGYYGEGVEQVFTAWRKEIARTLGRCPSPDTIQGRFGPGSTYLNRRDLITVAHKLHDNYSSTPTALTVFRPVWSETAWGRHAAGLMCSIEPAISGRYNQVFRDIDFEYDPKDFTILRGNRFTTVPKNALRDRGIAVEPSLNVFYQLGLGQVITKRLGKSYGWSKRRAQSYHRILARRGSMTNENATIDLSMASDTVSKVLVELLLPPDWFDLLSSLRCTTTRLGGRVYHLEKFSSMGNGFTFELETTIFLCLCKSLYKLRGIGPLDSSKGRWISVFGDDIIVPKELAADVIAILAFSGFSTNVEKTFIDGPFRESCGGDYFLGADVRPHFQKSPLTEPQHIIACINGLQRYKKRCEALGIDKKHSYIGWLIGRLPRPIQRCRGPERLGDIVIREDDETRWNYKIRNSIRYFSVYRPVTNHQIDVNRFGHRTALAVALYQAGDGLVSRIASPTADPGRSAGVVPRIKGSYVRGYKLGRATYS